MHSKNPCFFRKGFYLYFSLELTRDRERGKDNKDHFWVWN